MSTRTIIEINHDFLDVAADGIPQILRALPGSDITAELNKRGAYSYCPGVRILGQRHHSEPEWKPPTQTEDGEK